MSTPTCGSGYQVPGPKGDNGTNGTNGTNGLNAFSRTTANFTVPNVGDGVVISVNDTTWMQSGNAPLFMYVAIQNAGTYQVQNVVNATQVAVVNTGYPGNVAPTTVIASGSYVAPSGIRGATGPAGGGGAPGTILPTTTKGDLVVEQAAGPHPNPARFAVGSSGDVLHADAAQPLALQYRAIDLDGNTTNLSGTLAIGAGGTGQVTRQAACDALLAFPATTGGIPRYNGTHWVNLPTPGGTAAFLRADGTYAIPVVSGNFGKFQVHLAANFAFPAASETTTVWDTTDINSDGAYNAGTGVYTVPFVGLYIITAKITLSGAQTIKLYGVGLGGTFVTAVGTIDYNTIVYLAAGTVITANVISGANGNVLAGSYMSIVRVS